MSAQPAHSRSPLWRKIPESIGAAAVRGLTRLGDALVYVGGVARLQLAVVTRLGHMFGGRAQRSRYRALFDQMFRVGVKSIPIVMLVQVFVGIILALNMAPTLQSYGQLERTADIVAIAVVRELGPLITAIVLSGFAGASIAAELGTMVEGEEIKALRAAALDPIRFLVVPRSIATTIMMFGLGTLADFMGVIGGWITGVFILDIPTATYINETHAAITHRDFLTGLFKAVVFGFIIASLACYEGLHVQGGAEGVGRGTTTTVVKSIVSLIAADCVFTAIFYVLGW